MSDPFLGEIKIFAGNFAPRGWAFCDGQLVAISSNDALFSLLGTIYGGDGRTTFGLPDLRGRLPIHMGQGPGLTTRILGTRAGTESHTVTAAQLPSHRHAARATTAPASSQNPAGRLPAAAEDAIYHSSGGGATMASNPSTQNGGSQSHSNLQPSLCVHFIIALVGIYPSRS